MLIVEVLSEETRAYDRGGKFMRYRMMESFREYVLIDQSLPFVEVFYKNELNTWEYRAYTDLEVMIPLHSLDIEIPMADIYMGVDFLPFDPENLQLL